MNYSWEFMDKANDGDWEWLKKPTAVTAEELAKRAQVSGWTWHEGSKYNQDDGFGYWENADSTQMQHRGEANKDQHPGECMRTTYGRSPGRCSECDQWIECCYSFPPMREHNACLSCAHWLDLLRLVNDPNSVRVDGGHYLMYPSGGSGGMRGFGGRMFAITFNDGRTVTCNNLWSQGAIPERFRDRLPDNAVFVP